MSVVLTTGAAGFIGYHTSRRLLERGETVIGVDNLNDYYSVSLKQDRLNRLTEYAGFKFYKLDLADRQGMADLFAEHAPQRVVHLGAQAGVRYSLENPHTYADSNLTGFLNIIEGCRHQKVEHLVFASSSSVYGANKKQPFSVKDRVDHPISLYAATKKANEAMAHAYSHLFGIPMTGLRFFTVYGPWGRPDMAAFLFTKAIVEGSPIDVFNEGRMRRDFTYVDDIVEGIIRTLDRAPRPNSSWTAEDGDPSASHAPYKIYNIGNHQPVELSTFIEVLEECLGKKAVKRMLPMQPGDVLETCADTQDLRRDTGFEPSTPLTVGLAKFVDWYKEYYKVGI